MARRGHAAPEIAGEPASRSPTCELGAALDSETALGGLAASGR